MAVRPSLDKDTPGCGSVTVETSWLARSVRATSVITSREAGLDAIGPLWSTTTTWSAVDLERRRAQTGEVALDDVARFDGLARRVLPAGAGQRMFHADCEDAEGADDHQPQEQHGSEVGRRPTAEPGHWAAATRWHGCFVRCRVDFWPLTGVHPQFRGHRHGRSFSVIYPQG
jgi:hypothetical protein